MPLTWESQLAEAPGFGQCEACSYVLTGPYALCFTCARRVFAALPDPNARCDVCDRPYDEDATSCRNYLCNDEGRWFERNYAITYREPGSPLERAINRYKFNNAWGWALIFGRVLVGYLELERSTFAGFDLIIASPTFFEDRPFNHTALVLEKAAAELGPGTRQWPFEYNSSDQTLVKTAATPRLSSSPSIQGRVKIATETIRGVLEVRHPERVSGRSILVYDDIFTTGNTLNEVARVLREGGGAERVCGISLCRQPFRQHRSSE